MSNIEFAKKALSNTVFAIADVLLTKCATILAFVLLVRLLPSEAIAAIGIATGYLMFIAYLDIQPIRVLMRDYPSLRSDETKRDELLTAFFGFWCLQVLAMLLVAILIIIWILDTLAIPGLQFLYFAMTLDFIALTLQGWIKWVYYANFQQRDATRLSFKISIVRVSAYLLLLVMPALSTYAWILIISAFGSCVVWVAEFRRRFKFSLIVRRGGLGVVGRSLKDYGIWDHLNRSAVATLFIVDLVILSWFVGTRDMSAYTVALRFASLLALVPAQLTDALQVASATYHNQGKRLQAINIFLKVNGIISVAQFLVILIFGNVLMTFLFGEEMAESAITYAVVIAGGISVFNLSYPLMGICNNYCKLRKAFLSVYFPGLVVGVLTYILSAAKFGAIGIAWANVFAYIFIASALALFISKSYPIPLRLKLVTPQEFALIRQFIFGAKN